MYAGAPYAGFPYAGDRPFGTGGGVIPDVPTVVNRFGGRRRGAYALVNIDVAVVLPPYATPGHPAFVQDFDKAVAYPAPALVDGRPT